MGSIVRSTGYMVLQRPVEPAGIIGRWPISPSCRKPRPTSRVLGIYADGPNPIAGFEGDCRKFSFCMCERLGLQPAPSAECDRGRMGVV